MCWFVLVSMINPILYFLFLHYCVYVLPYSNKSSWLGAIHFLSCVIAGGFKMSLVSSGFTVLFWNPWDANSLFQSQEPRVSPLLKNWCIGLWKCLKQEKAAWVEFTKWEPQARGLTQRSEEVKGAGNVEGIKSRVWYNWPRALAMSCGIQYLKGAWGTLASACASEKTVC